jgi:DNA repair protein RecN (Recombination protein N)
VGAAPAGGAAISAAADRRWPAPTPGPILDAVLRTLELRDFAIVDALALELEPGFNALTGETGAGKSILIDALSLLTGGRADSTLIRAGRDAALVQGLFEDAPFESASRRLSRNGRHSARIDGEVVTVSELVERSAELVAIFGQHGATELMRPGAQRRQLDRMLSADAADELQRYHQAFRRYREVTAALSELREAARDRARRLDMLAFQIGEIEAAELTPGEETRLEAEVERLRHAERIALSASHAFSALADAEPNAVERAAEGLRELRTAARHDARLEALVTDLEQAATALQAVADEVGSFLSDFQADPARLDVAQGRLAAIETLRRKYGASVADVLDFRDGASRERERLEHVEADTRALEQEAAHLREQLEASAGTLTAARQRAADELGSELLPLLAELGMDRARFEVELETTEELGPHGRDGVRFRFVAHPGEPPAPLSDVASGGELSRVMLALNLVTGNELPVLAFDEIDAGIGGRTARAVGALLKRLSERHQVLVVTHLPQVAAFADAQYAVTKEELGGRTVTRVARLDRPSRLEELARMLSGRVTEASLHHAEELLEQADAAPQGPAGVPAELGGTRSGRKRS